MELGLKGKVAMVAASSKGLGFGIAKALGEEGALITRLQLQSRFSFYRKYEEWIRGGFVFIFIVLIFLAHVRGKIFQK